MANHVSTYIEFHNKDPELQEKLHALIDETVKGQYDLVAHEMLAKFGISVPEEDDIDRDWYIENVGAKWCYLDDGGDSYMSTVSAWSVPYEMATALCKHFSKEFPKTFATLIFEDEGYNFIGSAVVDEAGIDDVEELDCDEIQEGFKNDKGSELTDEEVWEHDELYEWVAEWLGDANSRSFDYYMESLEEAEREDLLDSQNLSGC